ncbi:hypothetical protein [Nocardiopsis sp. YSL2]|uniref:hypothetical protein n=1 Tax=Nocardiopsis sp. YSL2 TaxID=2939492 RepID=UPI0026F4188D|nr:hypothetical protein [Nocardiopsis sp. YSL2]
MTAEPIDPGRMAAELADALTDRGLVLVSAAYQVRESLDDAFTQRPVELAKLLLSRGLDLDRLAGHT